MSGYESFFSGKQVTVLGLGLLGRGVGDAEFIAQFAKEVIVTDKKSEAELAESVARLKKYSNIIFHLGGHEEKDFTDTDMIIKAAGVRLDSSEIAAARAAGVPVYMSTALFAKFAQDIGATIVGITGTRGKTTVTQMIYHTLEAAKGHSNILKNVGILLGGNVRGLSTLAMIRDLKKGDICVLELDSWQLQGFGDLEISPQIAVFTNLMPDHQNYYASMDAYFDDKANIFKYQKTGNTLIAGNGLTERLQTAHTPCEPFLHTPIPADWTLKIPGEHNRENASLAKAALEALGLSESEIKRGLESFEGVEGRLQFVREINGIKIYNDNNATTQEATIAALRALGDPEKKKIVLIVGGDNKGLDMSKLVEEIPKWCSKVVLFKERGTNTIRGSILAVKDLAVYEEDGLLATVSRAMSLALPGEIILYSPAFSSFGKYFKNEFDRGDQFMEIIRELS